MNSSTEVLEGVISKSSSYLLCFPKFHFSLCGNLLYLFDYIEVPTFNNVNRYHLQCMISGQMMDSLGVGGSNSGSSQSVFRPVQNPRNHKFIAIFSQSNSITYM